MTEFERERCMSASGNTLATMTHWYGHKKAKLMGWVIATLNIKLQYMGLPDPKSTGNNTPHNTDLRFEERRLSQLLLQKRPMKSSPSPGEKLQH